MASIQFALQVRSQLCRRHADLLQEVGNQAVGLADQSQQQMLAIDFLMREALSDALRLLHRFLRFESKLIELHSFSYSYGQNERSQVGEIHYEMRRKPKQ